MVLMVGVGCPKHSSTNTAPFFVVSCFVRFLQMCAGRTVLCLRSIRSSCSVPRGGGGFGGGIHFMYARIPRGGVICFSAAVKDT